MPIRTRVAVLLLVILAAALTSANNRVQAASLGPGDHTIALEHGGRERSAIVHVSRRAGEKSALPVVLNFHGGGGHGANQKEYSLLDSVAESESFVAVYPNGNGRFESRLSVVDHADFSVEPLNGVSKGGRASPLVYLTWAGVNTPAAKSLCLLTWNAGTCCAYAAIHNVDDVGFVRALLTVIAEKLPIDRRRVYATGLSNGGMMSHRLAAQASDIFAAVAPIAGGMVLPTITSSRAIPIMHIHSVDDPRALYSGGLGPPFPLTKSQVFHPNIDHMIAQWVKHNGCAGEPNVVERRTDQGSRGHTATKYVYSSCRDGVEVVLWKLTGAGHVWPGGKQKVMERILGPSTDIIDANREMWNFFSRFAL